MEKALPQPVSRLGFRKETQLDSFVESGEKWMT
jgi:hypothetical protein